MKFVLKTLPVLILAFGTSTGVNGQSESAPRKSAVDWMEFPDNAKFKVLGLPWFEQNRPRLWRMPAKSMDSLPKGVQGRSKLPSGGRILLRCNSTRLAIRAEAANSSAAKQFDAYVNGQPCAAPVVEKKGDEIKLVLFENFDNQEKEIVIYLPHVQEVVIKAIGVDRETRFTAPEHKFARPLPVVFYGSSVCQGSGALHPGQTYPAILCRELNLDLVNFGFGGAGKAEANVVELVNSIPACCYVFDLGKSYGAQDATAFHGMLQTVRKTHPGIPVITITPITSVKEVREPSYSERSIHTRTVMREAVTKLTRTGEQQMVLIEGEDLLGFKEHQSLSKDGVHPSDQGYSLIAGKLSPVLKQALGL